MQTVLGECLAVLLAWRGGLVVDLDAEVIGEFDAALSASSTPPSSRRVGWARLASLRQLLYETRVVDTAPRGGEGGRATSSSASPMSRWPNRSAKPCCATTG